MEFMIAIKSSVNYFQLISCEVGKEDSWGSIVTCGELTMQAKFETKWSRKRDKWFKEPQEMKCSGRAS
jgi:hypothetical protein